MFESSDQEFKIIMINLLKFPVEKVIVYKIRWVITAKI